MFIEKNAYVHTISWTNGWNMTKIGSHYATWVNYKSYKSVSSTLNNKLS